ncbi:hypothetical protein BHU72_13925 [Desulfuribacillus stibiiarsenatis]|uniref:Methyltransferase small domain-containing protein n=1 Tax=Desulfuribacillus stibiiarsenatis TaxID=1390249 RepID=A0A1E5L830_9FIRM|nr:methyltransferase [Desulfuribacillus stibiiarsenatis]OEH86317.1 hypothetical protein BHU72_13925 [Desulfuribacillus stibiiarsenatis]
MDYYYSKNPQVSSNESTIKAHLRGNEWTFVSDAGVFSKKGIDFGSRLLVETIQITNGESLLDLGCGYGVVGIVLAYETPAGRILMTDINERAISLARKNCIINLVRNANQLVSDGFEQVPRTPFHHIALNPPIRAGKAKIYSMFEDSVQFLDEKGSFWIVMHKKHGAMSAVKKLESMYKTVEIVNKESGYQIIKATNG